MESVVHVRQRFPVSLVAGVHLPPGTLVTYRVMASRVVGSREGFDARSWVVATEVNRFHWPGFDLRRTPEGRETWGELPLVLLRAVIGYLNTRKRRRATGEFGRDTRSAPARQRRVVAGLRRRQHTSG